MLGVRRLALGLACVLAAGTAEASSELDACLESQSPVRVARVLDAAGSASWVRVLAHEGGVPTEVAPIGGAANDLAAVFEQAPRLAGDAPRWRIGSELFAALEACGADGLGLELAVDEGEGFRERQRSTTARMILDPHALLARLAEDVKTRGARSPMQVRRATGVRDYPLVLAGEDGALRLPAGSVVLTGTPEGVALQAPSPLAVAWRGLLALRGPFEQFRQEELARAAAGGPGGYLAAGDRVRARIDGLGAQVFEIAAAGSPLVRDPCIEATEDPSR